MSLRRYVYLLLLPVMVFAQTRVDASLGAFRAQEQVMYLRSGDEVRRLVPGFEGLMADVYWLRTVQYFGHQRLFSAERKYELLRPLIEITTDLDPKLELAYRYGAVFLSEPWPEGAGKPEEGIQVLEKGVRALPSSWKLRWDLGAFWFYFMKDSHKAAEVLIEAARLPGAPFWLESLGARFLMGDDRNAARELWRRQYEEGFSQMRDNALYHLQLLDALDMRDGLGRLAERFEQANGRWPRSLQELVTAGYLRQVPTDPSGTEFDYDPETGQVAIRRGSRFWKRFY